MSIKQITTNELRRMKDREGLILKGCGGSLDDWVNGINDLLTEEKILLDGSRFSNCASFEHNGTTCLLFPFEDVKLDIGRFAMWRLKTHDVFYGKWLSDFVPNALGGYIADEAKQKPDCQLIGQDGNVFNLMGIAAKTLRRNGMADRAKEMCDRIYESGSYHEALNIIGEYVNITGPAERLEDEFDEEMDGMDFS